MLYSLVEIKCGRIKEGTKISVYNKSKELRTAKEVVVTSNTQKGMWRTKCPHANIYVNELHIVADGYSHYLIPSDIDGFCDDCMINKCKFIVNNVAQMHYVVIRNMTLMRNNRFYNRDLREFWI